MSILGIIGICLAITFIPAVILRMIGDTVVCENYDNVVPYWVISIISCIVIWTGSLFIGIGINTNAERVYIKKYLAQKQTIEQSLKNENLTGLERVQLVIQATELNGEFAERKARFDLWYFVVYDNTIYDNVELINLQGE